MSLFGRGGKPNDFNNVTSPSPLDINNAKASIDSRMGSGYIPPSFDKPKFNMSDGSKRVNTVAEYSDMSSTDKVEDERIKRLRIEGYELANKERKLDIEIKHDFTKIVKISIIVGVIIILAAVLIYFGLYSFLSVKNNELAEKGILSTILDVFLNLLKIALM